MRILVVEDDPKVARFIERGLKEEAYVVDVAGDGEEGLFKASGAEYELIILDVMLPKKNGFEVLQELRAAGCPSRILMLTARDGVKDRVTGLDKGADDYLTKPFAFTEFLARVRALMRRGVDGSPVLSLDDLRLDPATRKVTRAGKIVTLTAKEYAVLAYLMRNPGRVVTRTELSEHAWDESFDAMSNVIDVTVYHLREKIDRGRESPLVRTLRGSGYVIGRDQD